MLEDHNNREKVVMHFLNSVTTESTCVLLQNNGHDVMPTRLQMVILFGVIDVFANYWYEYQGLCGKTNQRPREWFERFCQTTDNEYYTGVWQYVNGEILYNLRNSLAHFAGLGEVKDGVSFALLSNVVSPEQFKQFESGFTQHNKTVYIIQPASFHTLIKAGGILMMNEWLDNIAAAQSDKDKELAHIEGIRRIWEKVQSEGAVHVNLEGKVEYRF